MSWSKSFYKTMFLGDDWKLSCFVKDDGSKNGKYYRYRYQDKSSSIQLLEGYSKQHTNFYVVADSLLFFDNSALINADVSIINVFNVHTKICQQIGQGILPSVENFAVQPTRNEMFYLTKNPDRLMVWNWVRHQKNVLTTLPGENMIHKMKLTANELCVYSYQNQNDTLIFYSENKFGLDSKDLSGAY